MKNKTHWLSSANKNYLGHWDLPEKEDLVLTIKSGGYEQIYNPLLPKDHAQQNQLKKVVHWQEKGVKPLIVNQINSQNIILSTGFKYIEDSIGKKVALYIGKYKNRTTKELEDCVRIRPTAPKPKQKPSISKERFEKALESIKTGQFSKEKLISIYSLTPQQKTALNEL